ncbi:MULTISPECIES: glycosyltransferase family 2 protein [unclassified Clostridium]|uniref:glycosyltransferase family 2 protein n=1 Tax=unclassified Clostridium TaxID=2614128 RepID=UPI000297ECAA|nr:MULTISPECIES: glycosyltransferase family 2 protein [unclassified Clostridium]EKQ55556.1 MAG: glycosyl transferase [Clostridium sp. Maddingley MBC34-26]
MNKSVSIVIPCRNEEKYIKDCITSFLDQSYPKELLTIIVSDGMSTDNTRNIIKELQKDNNNVVLLENEGLTAPKGMNLGIKYSKSDIIIIFGAHAYADKDFVAENVKALENKEVGCAGGLITTINDSIKGAAIAEGMSCPFGVGNALFRFAEKECFVDTVAFGAYRRELLNEIGYFDEELVRNQDDELNYRVVKSGAKILLSPKIKSTYFGRGDLKKLWKQYFQYGFWKVRVIQKHKKPAALRHLIPMLFVLFLAVGGTLSIFSKFIRIPYLLILALYVIMDLIFSAKISAAKKMGYFKYLIFTFPILHISYGLGFLLGIVNFYLFKNSKLEESNKEMSR